MTDSDVPAPERAVLPRDLSEFLAEFSIGVHRFAMYPPGHPSLDDVVKNVEEHLGALLLEQTTLSIGVAHRQLIIEGVATDARHPLLSDLAKRLHDHQLAAISFERGVDSTEVAGLMEELAGEALRGGTPLGLRPQSEFPKWEHARLYPLGYDHLEIKGEPGASATEMDRTSLLWLGLARSALASEEPLGDDPDPSIVAKSIGRHRGESAYEQVVVGYLLQLAEELKTSEGAESESVSRRVSELIDELDDDTLSRLINFKGDAEQQQRFALDANQVLAADSVLKVLNAAASNSEQTISHSMTRLLTKLATHAEEGSGQLGAKADAALRDNVEALISDWALEDPNPGAYTNVLDAMARSAPIFEVAAAGEEEPLTGAERLVEMALEIDAWGPMVEKAVGDFVEDGGASTLIHLVREAPEHNQVAAHVLDRLTSPAAFHALVQPGTPGCGSPGASDR